uniref:EF-hand domain-containing protein n=1 Tax=Strombidium rassoulzadegani TaxID=1082188 RepID=A0A7S3CKC2_9SPIT|mmetsp:Transcript_14225/g.24197  ORF Transcript_14225/g.24197 Transcript_14225/m.24197 type:complete len:106 (+) Transcript_14225:115-432(+)
MFAMIDLDGNGTIDYTEFVMATINEKNLMTQERLQMAFNTFDTDNSGALSPEEIRQVLCYDQKVDPEEIEKIIEEFDENGDGEIQFDEFCRMMTKLSGHQANQNK